MLQTALAIPLGLSVLFGGTFMANEWSHGSMAEGMGMDHHHVFDYDGLHCTRHDDASRGASHVEHMHGNQSMPHSQCSGGDRMHGGGMGHGMMEASS